MKRVFKPSLFNIGLLLLAVGVLLALLINTNQVEKRPQAKSFRHKIAYNSYEHWYQAKVYDFSTNKTLNLKSREIGYITSFLWSSDGEKLAVLVQGEYDPKYSFKIVQKAHATTQGFNYLIYSVDLQTGDLNLLHNKLFGNGAVKWSKNSSGLYYTEQYYEGKPLIRYNQSGHKLDKELYFFVNLKENKKEVSKQEYTNSSFVPTIPSLTSPDGELKIIESDNIVGDRKMKVLDKNGKSIVTLKGRGPTWAPVL